MRPLVSPVREYRSSALGFLVVGGMPFAIVGLAEEGLKSAAFSTAWMFVSFGGGMYVFSLRRIARREIARAVAAPIADRDRPANVWRRVIGGLTIVALLDVAIVLACYATGWPGNVPVWSILAGENLGMGAALLLCSRWLRVWEVAHGELLLIEPARRRDSWRRGGNASSISRPGRYFLEPARVAVSTETAGSSW